MAVIPGICRERPYGADISSLSAGLEPLSAAQSAPSSARSAVCAPFRRGRCGGRVSAVVCGWGGQSGPVSAAVSRVGAASPPGKVTGHVCHVTSVAGRHVTSRHGLVTPSAVTAGGGRLGVRPGPRLTCSRYCGYRGRPNGCTTYLCAAHKGV